MIRGYYPISGVSEHLNKLLRILFDQAQGIQRKVYITIPDTNSLGKGEMCWYKSSTGVIRLYINLEGTIAYVQFTNV